MAMTASVSLRHERRYCAPRTGERNDLIADLRAVGMEAAAIALEVGTTLQVVIRVLADQAAVERQEARGRLSDAQERKFARAMDGRSYEDVPLRAGYRAPLFSRRFLPP